MCNVCFKEFRGWIKSFTLTELLLSLLEVVLLTVLLGFLVFLILHLLTCPKKSSKYERIPLDNESTSVQVTLSTANITSSTSNLTVTTTPKTVIEITTNTGKSGMKCTWQISKKTEVDIHYFYSPKQVTTSTNLVLNDHKTVSDSVEDFTSTNIDLTGYIEDLNVASELVTKEDVKVLSDISNGNVASDVNKHNFLALVKIRPPRDITFGCILTVIDSNWVLTAASCIEAIEEVDTLDNFVMVKGYDEDYTRHHQIADVQIHPLYQGANRSYDLAAFKSEDSLLLDHLSVVELPQLLDYFLLTIGEQFSVIGYGPFRTTDKATLTKSLYRVHVYKLPNQHCPLRSDTWQWWTLKPGEPVMRAPCGTSPLCVGVLSSRGMPCNYCAGTPLMYGNVLYGIMSDNQQCGVSCEPQIYVNIALVRDWIDSLIDIK